MLITSRANPRLKEIAALKNAKVRATTGLILVEGIRLTREALASPLEIEQVIIAEKTLASEAATEIIATATAKDIEILEVVASCYGKISELRSPEGIAVVYKQPHYTPESLFADSQARLVVLCGVQDPGNAGAIMRIAEAAGASGCVFLGGTTPQHPKTVRGAMGSAFRLPYIALSEDEFLEKIKTANLRLLTAAATGKKVVDYTAVDYTPAIAICLGGEGAGIPDSLAQQATGVRIPMVEPVESLNVAVAAGIILYQARQSWQTAKRK